MILSRHRVERGQWARAIAERFLGDAHAVQEREARQRRLREVREGAGTLLDHAMIGSPYNTG
jgi:hypothetical protein